MKFGGDLNKAPIPIYFLLQSDGTLPTLSLSLHHIGRHRTGSQQLRAPESSSYHQKPSYQQPLATCAREIEVRASLLCLELRLRRRVRTSLRGGQRARAAHGVAQGRPVPGLRRRWNKRQAPVTRSWDGSEPRRCCRDGGHRFAIKFLFRRVFRGQGAKGHRRSCRR